jgi:hypothetical protein
MSAQISGTKAQVVHRLLRYEATKQYVNMTDEELASEFSKRTDQPPPDTREELLNKLVEDDEFRNGWLEAASKAGVKRMRELTIKCVCDGLEPTVFTEKGQAQVTSAVLKQLAGDSTAGMIGTIFTHFVKLNQRAKGEAACKALETLGQMNAISTTINTFLLPLQDLADEYGRVHGSLNINTETGG